MIGHRSPRIAVAALAGLLLAAPAAALDGDIDAGRRIYLDGVLPDGAPLTALVAGDVPITGRQVVCGHCHRRSGLGASEGQEVAPPVAREILYRPWQLPTSRPPAPPVLRPAYDAKSLARAIRDGVGPDGRPFSLLMPRYDLSDAAMQDLVRYLESIEIGPDPGVTDTHIHFATIVGADVDSGARQAMLDVMDTFVTQKNTETRYESKRAAHGPWHKDWVFKPYRKWVVHTWELSGSPDTWVGQMARYYAEQPVFAILNGTLSGDWRPVHEYCESQRIPCLFPSTDLPVVDESDFYTVYFSKGMVTEAELVAGALADDETVLQVFDPGDARSRAAADALVAALGERVQSVTPDAWSADVAAERAVLWLTPGALEELVAQGVDLARYEQVYLSARLAGDDLEHLAAIVGRDVLLAYSTEVPGRTSRLLARSTGWFRAKRILDPLHGEIQANAYFALKAAGGALTEIRGFFRRDYFIEQLEHMTDNALYTSVYPRMSLAPEQRFVSRGGRIARLAADGGGTLDAVSDWIVPASGD